MLFRKAFADAQRFAVYYSPKQMEPLSTFDVVIIEPDFYELEDVRTLQHHHTLVVAYVSAMEMNESHPAWFSLWAEDFLRQANGDPVMQPAYDNSILNLASPHWRRRLLHHIGQLLTSRGYDGVLLDTIGDVEMPQIPEPWVQIDAAAALVREIRTWFPDKLVVQNNGLEMLCARTSPYLDGIIWENPPVGVKESAKWVRAVSERLHQMEREHGVRILVLFDGKEDMKRRELLERRRFADAHKFLAYMGPRHYQQVDHNL